MTMRADARRLIGAVCLLLSASATPRTAAAQSTSLLAMAGADTFSFERYERHGNVVTGSWVVLHPPGVYVHEYRITLGNDGLPMHYTMKYGEPLADTPPGLDSVVVDYGRDTVTYTFTTRDSTFGRKVALHEAFPFLGQSLVGLDLALRRLRAAHADSGVIVANETSNLSTPPRTMRVRFAGDTVILGQATRVHITPDGGLVDMSDGRLSVRRVASLDVPQLTKHFADEYAPRAAALRAAAAARVEIPLPAAQLDRFVGSYGRGVVAVTRDGDHLVATLQNRTKLTLLAMSQTEFFVRKPDLVVTFELDGGGVVRGLTLAQGEGKQRLVRDN
jgi:hypothetical protein